jgi:O-acetylhomoserine (thiol)-lyase
MKDQTLAIHAGFQDRQRHQGGRGANLPDRGVRVRQRQHGADLFNLEVPGNIYTRIMNPTTMCWSSAAPLWKVALRGSA